MFDYAKYENATQKEIIHALNLTQRKSEKLNQQLKENREIFKFLQKKLKESFSSKKTKKEKRRPELDEAIRQYENGEVEHYSSVEEAFKALNAE
ncbi:LETM1 domain-containing protein [Helicobacter pullorum]|uniref:Uncharacterized protein n=2 Tax=Helicobacter pullorum TaxID=35818 RepID=C5F1A5_9HELI|nr:LETM1 domain-containing protein [Helicobacter pullorum]EEQ64060.1 hypothetical protein HPMG_01517 [Helicobacter pullorum MIT 98-5489]KPH50119.1 hypothetical protein HPU229336_04590 [Helicobacter pullorum]OCR14754.1 hypothetical protein BA915_06845 [Helicobacter pullorum]OCR18176.1 hypothetical protein BA916_00195 [Helicobacter pullorum]HJF82971.1 LETM1 domain-containing protein [Helicobacter pullorum]